MGLSELKTTSKFAADDLNEEECLQGCAPVKLIESTEKNATSATRDGINVFLDRSCVRNGVAQTQAGIELFGEKITLITVASH